MSICLTVEFCGVRILLFLLYGELLSVDYMVFFVSYFAIC